MTTSTRYPPSAAQALGFLTAHNNDIEVYVEDTGAPNLWKKMLKRYLPPNIRLNSVNVLGSKINVIQACRLDQEIDGRKKLYIIDGDLQLLIGVKKPRLRHLYRLHSYCIENYLLDEDALVSAITTINASIDDGSARQQMDFHGWLERNRRCLQRLFICYAVTYQLCRSVQTVGCSVFGLINSQAEFDLCEKKVSLRVIRLYRIVRSNVSKQQARLAFERVQSNADSIGFRRYCSGKDYIFPLIYQRIKLYHNTNMPMDSFKVLVAQCLDKATDPYLLRRIRKVCA